MDPVKKNVEKREYIYCPSYPSLFFALYRKQNGSNIKIVTDNECIKKFCEDFNFPFNFFTTPQIPSIYKPIDYILFKKYLDKFIKTLKFTKDDQFFLLDYAYVPAGFYIAKECSKIGIVYFYLIGREYPIYVPMKKNEFKYYYYLVQFIIIKFFWGLDLIIRIGAGALIYGIDENFLKKNHINQYSPDKNVIDFKVEVVKHFSISMKNYQILIALEGEMSGLVDDTTILYELYLKIGSKVPSLVIKFHPQGKMDVYDNPNKLLLKNFDKFSECIPVELLLNNIDKCVIATISNALSFTARMNGIKAISLLDLLKWKDINQKESFRRILIQESDNRVLFPKTIEELFIMIG